MKQLTTVLALLSLAAFSSAQASPPEPRIFLTNHLGSVNQTLDANGEPEGAYRSYYPYGEMRTGEKTDGQVYGFNGNRTDTKTDLIDYNARHYDPVLGRFIMADTIVPNPADPQSWNRYSYVRNNPINMIDPTGHNEWRWSDANGNIVPLTAKPQGPGMLVMPTINVTPRRSMADEGFKLFLAYSTLTMGPALALGAAGPILSAGQALGRVYAAAGGASYGLRFRTVDVLNRLTNNVWGDTRIEVFLGQLGKSAIKWTTLANDMSTGRPSSWTWKKGARTLTILEIAGFLVRRYGDKMRAVIDPESSGESGADGVKINEEDLGAQADATATVNTVRDSTSTGNEEETKFELME